MKLLRFIYLIFTAVVLLIIGLVPDPLTERVVSTCLVFGIGALVFVLYDMFTGDFIK